MQSTLEVGDEVVLTSGVYGTVRGLDEGVANVEIADGVTVRVARGAIGQVLLDDAEPDDAEPDHDVEVPEEN
jgi:preprotein translocase subunit YajC